MGEVHTEDNSVSKPLEFLGGASDGKQGRSLCIGIEQYQLLSLACSGCEKGRATDARGKPDNGKKLSIFGGVWGG